MTTQTQLPLMLLAHLGDLARTNPVWYARFDDADLYCAHEELVELMHSAPNSEVRFFLLGMYSAKLAMACVTGRVA